MNLGDRMKKYENAYKVRFTDRLPIIVRLDGKAFHTITRQCEKPFDENLIKIFNSIGLYLFAEMQGSVFIHNLMRFPYCYILGQLLNHKRGLTMK